MFKNFVFLIGIFVLPISGLANDAIEHIQNASVTIKSGRSEGSGNVVTRDVSVNDKKTEKINFILTAGHVIDDLRSVREIVDVDGTSKKIVEFEDASIVKEFRQNGRRVGETKLDAKVLKFSDSESGEDLALLMVLMRNFINEGIEFYLNDDILPVGTDLVHCGSLLGQMGANSLTNGIMSQTGRVYKGNVYDQTTVTAFPGSSGGGVFVINNKKPKYVGMVVRGSGETFNLMIPIRRIVKWTKKNDIEWVVNPDVKVPTLDKILEMSIEAGYENRSRKTNDEENKKLIFLDGEHKAEWYRRINLP